MSGSWRDISRIIGIILALSLVAYNLVTGAEILVSLFRGVTAYLIFSILNIVFTTIVYKVVNDFEQQRLQKLNQLSSDFEYTEVEGESARKPAVAEESPE